MFSTCSATYDVILCLIIGRDSDSVVLRGSGHVLSPQEVRPTRLWADRREQAHRRRAVRQSVVATVGRADERAASGALASLLSCGARLCDQVLLIQALDDKFDE